MHRIDDLQQEYALRFEANTDYRTKVWKTLTQDFFAQFIPPEASVLDLGSGWAEFINNIQCREKYAMDLNPESGLRINQGVKFLEQDCSATWNIPTSSLDTVFSSNFFEHLPDKESLRKTLQEAYRCLKPGGKLICLGPNIKFIPGQYWDFWDHYLPLTELSLKEGMELSGFKVSNCIDRFLPYSMSQGSAPPLIFLKIYLRFPWLWRFFGKQFLVVGNK